ncbi:MAG: amino acid ABC transporter permease [Candidimonas sp.]|jgi:polar amino acid transport system permease protein
MDSFWLLFRRLYDSTGFNLPFLYDGFERSRFFAGIGTSASLIITCIAGSLLLGVIGAHVKIFWPRAGKVAVDPIVNLFRNTPPIIQLYFFYFAIGGLLPKVVTAGGGEAPIIGAFGLTVISLTIYTTAFNIESLRAGIEAVPATMVEAAEALGCTSWQIYCRILLPLGFRFSLPSLTNNLVDLVKQTSLAYAIAVPEILYVSTQIMADQFNVTETMITLLVVYTALVSIVVVAMRLIERALAMPGYER